MNLTKKLVNLALASALALGAAVPAFAHEAKCPYCQMAIVQSTKELDNEVALKYGNKRIEYRCVMCAIADSKTKYKGDVTITAPSETKDKPIVIKRTNGQWSAPEGAVFAYEKGSHATCQTRYRAVSSRAAYEKWVKANPNVFKNPQALSLAQMVEVSK